MQSRWRCVFSWLFVPVVLALPLTAHGYFLQLLDTSTTAPGPVLKVLDRNAGTTQTYNGGHSTVSNLTSVGGFVGYVSPGKVNFVAYDPGDRVWHAAHEDVGKDDAKYDLVVSSGVIVSERTSTATEDSQAFYSAYDPGDRKWHVASDTNVRTTYSDLVTSSGVFAYLRSNTSVDQKGVRYGAYDSIDRKWHLGSDAMAYADYSNLMISGGVLAYQISISSVDQSMMRYAAYDPGDHEWHVGTDDEPFITYSNLTMGDGIVAFEGTNGITTGGLSVIFAAFDPGDHAWHVSRHREYSSVSKLSISKGKVSWTADGKNYSFLAARKPGAYFTADRSSGNAPLYVQFSDNSIGSIASWQWNFGDGASSSTARSPSHTFAAGGVHTVTLTVSGPGGSASAKKTISVTGPTATPTRGPTPTRTPTPRRTPASALTGVDQARWQSYK